MPLTPFAQVLPSAVADVRRGLARDTGGRLVEVVDAPEGRGQRLPQGGVFSACALEGGRIWLGPPLTWRLSDLTPPPVVVLALAGRVLADLAVLHEEGGAHGALAGEGWGLDAAGAFQVRPCLHVPQRVGAPEQADVAAVGAIVAALAPDLGAVERASLWLRGLGVGTDRVGLGDARAAGQALAAVLRRQPVERELAAFLERVGGRLPPPAMWFGVRPAEQAAGAAARGWVAQELDRMRAERSRRVTHPEAGGVRDRVEAEQRAAAARAESERRAADERARVENERHAAEERARVERERRAAEERAEAERRGAEERARVEGERRAAEERARVEGERRAAEERARVENERRASEERARAESERRASEERAEADRRGAEERAEKERLVAEARAEEERRDIGEPATTGPAEAGAASRPSADAEPAFDPSTAARAVAAERRRDAAATASPWRPDAAEAWDGDGTEPGIPTMRLSMRVPTPTARREQPDPAAVEERPAAVPATTTGGGESPRWEGVGGVTGNRAREGEKGPGKWVEQGRSVAELTANLSEGGPRPVDLGGSPPPKRGAGIYVLGALVVAGLAAAWWWS